MIAITNAQDRHLVLLAQDRYLSAETLPAIRQILVNVHGLRFEWVTQSDLLRAAVSAFVACYGTNRAAVEAMAVEMFGHDPVDFVHRRPVSTPEMILALMRRIGFAHHVDAGEPDETVLPLALPVDRWGGLPVAGLAA